MAGTDGAILPFWSPRSDSIGFFADSKLKRIDVNGTVQTLADAVVGGRLGGSWSPTGDIIFNGAPGYPLFRVSEKGGERTPVTRVDAPRQGNHSRPQFLPDGRRFLLFVDAGKPEDRGVSIGSLDSPEVRLLFAANSPAVFMPPDRLMFLQQGTLFVRRFDPENGELDGEPLVVAKFSPDGRWIAYQSNDTGRFEIYIVPFPSLDSKVPISSGGGVMARWRRDGRELFYLSPNGKLMSVAITLSADGKTLKAGAASALFQTEALTLEPSPDINGHNYEVSLDGKRFLLYTRGEDSITSPITLIQNWTPFAK